MKKALSVLCVIGGIICILVALFLFFKINMVVQVIDGVYYDGFGNAYVNGDPSSPYTLFIYVFGLVGIGLFGLVGTLNEKNN